MLEVRMEKTAGVLLAPFVRVNMQRRRLHKGKQQSHVRQQAGEDTQQTFLSYLKLAAVCAIRGHLGKLPTALRLGATGILAGKAVLSLTTALVDLKDKTLSQNAEVAFIHAVQRKFAE